VNVSVILQEINAAMEEQNGTIASQPPNDSPREANAQWEKVSMHIIAL
jgi:hypothetical protein